MIGRRVLQLSLILHEILKSYTELDNTSHPLTP